MEDSAILCDEIKWNAYLEIKSNDEAKSNNEAKSNDEETKANFNEKKVTCKTQNFYSLLTFLLFITELLIAVSIYCYLIKYQAKQYC